MSRPESKAAPTNPAVYLQIRDIRKSFGAFTALDGIDLDVQSGEFLCFLGPSGCGKTTLLRVIAGLEVQDSGQIVQDGKDISRLPPGRRDFGIVFQSYALFPNLTAAENIGYGLRNVRTTKVETASQIQALLDLIGLPDSGSKFPAQLSGGQQQRIALARALALSPGLLLLDEPLSALDARVRANLRGEITRLHRAADVTTIMVTHDQEEALTMADRIAVMDHGHIVQVGTPLEIYRHPATPFVADFVGQMNFLQATRSHDGLFHFFGTNLCVDDPNSPAVKLPGPVTLAIRPEDIEIVHPRHSHQTNLVETILEHLEFLGPVYRLRLRVAHQGSSERSGVIVVELPAADARDVSFAEGFVTLRLPPNRLRLYPHEARLLAQISPNGAVG